MTMTARHLANLAPSSAYSASRPRRPSSPSVTVSPGRPASGLVPVSTLMPGSIPASARARGKVAPPDTRCRNVSSQRITPLTPPDSSGVVISSSR
jgi:hypothetical protein